MACKCNAPLQSMGLPDCTLVPERIVRFMFTPSLRAMPANGSPTVLPYADLWPSPVWALEPGLTPSPTEQLWPHLWGLVTPYLEDVQSERPEAITEEVGGTPFFVRYANRRMVFTTVRKPAEFGRLMAQLRCQKQVGVFIVDAEGRVWGERADTYTPDNPDNEFAERVKPIAVQPSTINERFIFASDATVAKYEVSFELTREFKDYELVPVWEGADILSYHPPIVVLPQVQDNDTVSRVAQVAIFARFAQGVRAQNIVPITTLSPAPRAYDANNTSCLLYTS
ncbi:MAG: hypothetical protein N2595_09600, partial [bacterium]|nr:hypothetical protein [bacterium]